MILDVLLVFKVVDGEIMDIAPTPLATLIIGDDISMAYCEVRPTILWHWG